MGLRSRFNAVTITTFVAGISVTGLVSHGLLQDNAREEVVHQAEIIMQGAMAVRHYTVNEIRPLLAEKSSKEFLPQTVPAYAAMKNVQKLRELYPEYSYKEATLNPTNPASRATDWETTIVEYFRNNKNESELTGERETATGASVYIARPIQIKSESCLACHGNVENAPPPMVERYGKANGFGWTMGEVVGAQVVNVPMDVALERANTTLTTFMLFLGGVFLVSMLIINLLLHHVVINPLRKMSSIANDVSMGQLDADDYLPQGKGEVSTLAESFVRMKRSLVNAMKMLDDD